MTFHPNETSPAIPFVRRQTAADLDAVATCRTESLFAADVAANHNVIASRLGNRRVLAVGGGGSIGAATVRLVLDYRPAAVHVVDQSENYLAELIRELRGRPEGLADVDFRTLPLDYGSPIMARLLRDLPPYDVVLNFAALKHVRSEKDVYSVLQMLDTNIVRHNLFKRWLADHRHGATYFAVSTDKAANPVSLMGASKRLMEDLIFSATTEYSRSTTSARFANVAFSNGSLLQGFVYRLAKRQPLAVPRDTQRYFISHHEAAELCLLAALVLPDRHIGVPRVNPYLQLQPLESIAHRFLEYHRLMPVCYLDEAQARRDVETLAARGRWPLLLTPLDTSGEKPYEEFVGAGETLSECGLAAMQAIHHVPSAAVEQGLFEQLQKIVNEPHTPVSKGELIDVVKCALTNFRHTDTGRDLDQRL
jgi:FlaA1/EpsC-like NDP-sugar epimerase